MSKKQPSPRSKPVKPNRAHTNPPEQPLLSWPVSQRRWFHIGLFLVIAIGGSWLALAMAPGGDVPRYTYKLIREHPHDAALFTQGLLIDDDGIVYESSGQYELSALTKYELITGKVLRQRKLDKRLFGEGLTKWGNRLIQLTWKENIALVYDLELNELKRFKFDGQGWGLTNTETELVMSNGTQRLSFLDPETFEVKRWIYVRMGRRPVSHLNELEYVGGKIYANQLDMDWIYEINPESGNVEAIIDLNGLWPQRDRPTGGLLNGIAFDPSSKRVIVTGKYCPTLFEIEFVPVK